MRSFARCLTAISAAVAIAAGSPGARGGDWGDGLGLVAQFLNVVPAALGPEIGGGVGTAVVIGWPCQLRLDGDTQQSGHHRLIGSPEIVIDGAHVLRGRAGYRYAHGPMLAGLGATFTGGGAGVSPEMGVRLGGPEFFFATVIARAELFHTGGEPTRYTLLVGWSYF